MDENFDLERFFKRVVSAKASAKAARDEDDWQEAIDILNNWISRVRNAKEEIAPRAAGRLDAELADLYGLIGGTQRRWGLKSPDPDQKSHLKASLSAYDEGFRYERSLNVKEATSYNRINRLVGRVLLDPSVLRAADTVGADVDLASELEEAEKIVTGQLESGRQRDPWAYCDLITLRLLRGAPNALATLGLLIDIRPPKFVYDSSIDTLEPLERAAADLLPDLSAAVIQMRRAMEYAR